jgi:hypothetical protein
VGVVVVVVGSGGGIAVESMAVVGAAVVGSWICVPWPPLLPHVVGRDHCWIVVVVAAVVVERRIVEP